MKLRELETFSKQFAISVKSYISDVLRPVQEKITQLDNRISAIKQVDVDDIALTAAGLIDVPKNGKDGINGIDGKDGANGKDGVDGLNGKSAYELAVDSGFSGSISEWLLTLKGESGKDGTNGKDGENGKDGINGKDGADGINGRDGNDGKDGKDGINGKDGADGINGKDGQDGLNALDIDILPGIDEEKSYNRGAYATHNGGLWRAHSTTKGFRGWECIVNGIKHIDIEQSDPRNFTIKVLCSNGEIEEKTFSIPTLIYKGVFKDGESYQAGDTVTWAGSLWHCDAETTDKPGEINSKGWTLAAKRGRDGRDKQ